MNDNKIAAFFDKYWGVIIGIIVGILIISFDFLTELFRFVLIIGVCGWAGNYFHKHKDNVKNYLKQMIDKM